MMVRNRSTRDMAVWQHRMTSLQPFGTTPLGLIKKLITEHKQRRMKAGGKRVTTDRTCYWFPRRFLAASFRNWSILMAFVDSGRCGSRRCSISALRQRRRRESLRFNANTDDFIAFGTIFGRVRVHDRPADWKVRGSQNWELGPFSLWRTLHSATRSQSFNCPALCFFSIQPSCRSYNS